MSAQHTEPLRYRCPECKLFKVAEEGERCLLCDLDDEDQMFEDRDMGDS